MRTDIVRTYKDIHSWVGIFAGLLLFTAFFAGAITMFEDPLDAWASPPVRLSPPPSLENTPQLIQAVLRQYPQARRQYEIILNPSANAPARMLWDTRPPGPEQRGGGVRMGASLTPGGTLEVAGLKTADVANFVNVLHQQLAIPLDREIALPMMGVVALLYAIALTSGIIVLLPSLVKDLFALRLGKNLKRMWLDVHNVLGLFSLPFHIVMAVTSVIFAFHDQIYQTQDHAFYGGNIQSLLRGKAAVPHKPGQALLPPAEVVRRVQSQAPGFAPQRLLYRNGPRGMRNLAVWGTDDRYPMRAPTEGFVTVDPSDGKILNADYLPGHAAGSLGAVVNFFSLHFGSFGGQPVRWGYFFLGLAGAFLFYTGNIIWVETRRRRERATGETRATRILDRLTVGWCLGTVTGIAITIAAAKWLAPHAPNAPLYLRVLFYGVLLLCVGWCQIRAAGRFRRELQLATALALAAIPATSAIGALGGPVWNNPWPTTLVDIVALLGSAGFLFAAYQNLIGFSHARPVAAEPITQT